MTFLLYVWDIWNGIIGIPASILAASIIVLVISVIVEAACDCDYRTVFENYLISIRRKMAIVLIISGIITVLLPSKDGLAMMYVVPKIANSEIAKDLPADLTEIYKDGMKELKGMIKSKAVEGEKND